MAWAGQAQAQEAVTVAIEPRAKLMGDGTVRVVVVASCDSGDQVLEAHLSVSQDDQAIFGQAGIPVRCDGRARRYRVTVSPHQGAVQAGDAIATAVVLTSVDPPTGGAPEQGQDARTITVR